MLLFAGLAALLPQHTGSRMLVSVTTPDRIESLLRYLDQLRAEQRPVGRRDPRRGGHRLRPLSTRSIPLNRISEIPALTLLVLAGVRWRHPVLAIFAGIALNGIAATFATTRFTHGNSAAGSRPSPPEGGSPRSPAS